MNLLSITLERVITLLLYRRLFVIDAGGAVG